MKTTAAAHLSETSVGARARAETVRQETTRRLALVLALYSAFQARLASQLVGRTSRALLPAPPGLARSPPPPSLGPPSARRVTSRFSELFAHSFRPRLRLATADTPLGRMALHQLFSRDVRGTCSSLAVSSERRRRGIRARWPCSPVRHRAQLLFRVPVGRHGRHKRRSAEGMRLAFAAHRPSHSSSVLLTLPPSSLLSASFLVGAPVDRPLHAVRPS